MNTYALYDTKDYECLVTMGSINELAKYIGTTTNNIRCCYSRKRKLLHRYEIAKIEEKEE